MNTFISVIVPVYNIEDLLPRCINSIENQTYREFELILVDDGSKDSSGRIIDEAAQKYDNVIALHKENGGTSTARNMGMEHAKGEYYSFIDSDDYIDADFLETLVAPINAALKRGEKPPLIVQIGRDEVDEQGGKLPNVCDEPDEVSFIDSKSFFRELILHKGDCSLCTKLTHKKFFEKLRFPVGKLNEDFGLLIHFLLECDGILCLPGYKYHVFYRLGSNTRKVEKNNFSRVFKDNIENADEVIRIVDKHFPDLHDIAIRFGLFQRLDYLLHIPIDYMRGDYEGYRATVSFVRKNWLKGMRSEYLTTKNKLYLTIFAIAPKLSRVVHAKIKHL